MRRSPEAIRLYEDFHRFEPKEIGYFKDGLCIPSHVYLQGPAINVMYRSDKIDPATLKKPRKPVDYIHEHEDGVHTYLVDGDGKRTEVPRWLVDCDTLVLMGGCLGFSFRDPNGDEVEAECKKPLPELYSTPNGKALLVIEKKSTIVAITWGGRLGVEPRGIVG